MIKCCLFDLDGTLLDTLRAISYYANKALTDNGIEEISIDDSRRFIGNGAEIFIDRIFKSKGIVNPKLQEKVLCEYKAAYDSEPLYLTEPYAGVPEMVEALLAGGIKVCVLSNKPDVAVKGIMERFFPNICSIRGARTGIPLKPDPTAASELISTLGAIPSETAVIGDSPEDIKTALNLGAALKIGVSWGFRSREKILEAGADAVVDNPADILREVFGYDKSTD